MKKTSFILLNDSFIESSVEDLKLSANDRAFQFGDGVYEVIRIYQGKFHLLDEHIERLYRSLELIQLEISYTDNQFKEKLVELVHKNQFEDDGFVYLHISRGVANRQHHYPTGTNPTIMAYVREAKRPHDEMNNGGSVLLYPDNRWLQCNIKSLNLLANAQAKQKANEGNHVEAIFYREPIINTVNPLHAEPTENAFITEGSSSNLFMIKDGIIYTHQANHLILNGIVRQRVIKLAKQLGFLVEEKQFTIDELKQADEVFITSTTKEMIPVTSLHDFKGNQIHFEIGKVVQQLQDKLNEEIEHIHTIKL